MSKFIFTLLCTFAAAVAAMAQVQAEHDQAIAGHIAALKDPYWPDRYRAAEALGKLGDDAAGAVPALRDALGDKERFVRQKAAEALGKIGPDAHVAVPGLMTLLKEPNEYTREEAARALGKIGAHAREAVPALRAALEDAFRDVRNAAAVALKEIAVPPAPPLPQGLTILKRASAPFTFSPDGKTLATGGADGVILWDTATWKKLATLKATTSPAVFSSDGKLLAASFQYGAKVWDVAARKERTTLWIKDNHHLVPLYFRPDGKALVAEQRTSALFSSSSELRIFDLATGQEHAASDPSDLAEAEKIDAKLQSPVRLHGDDDPINLDVVRMIADDGRVEAWVARTPAGIVDCKVKLLIRGMRKELLLKGHTSAIDCLALSADGKRLASADRAGNVKLWETATGKELGGLKLPAVQEDECKRQANSSHPRVRSHQHYLEFSPDGKLLILRDVPCWTAGIKVWDAGNVVAKVMTR